MELIGSILSKLRADAPLLVLMHAARGAAVDVVESKVLQFHYVRSGECRITTGASSASLTAGDLVLMPHGLAFRLEVGTPGTVSPVYELLETRGLPVWTATNPIDEPLMLDVGEPPFAVSLLGGLASLGDPRSNLLLPHLPEIMLFRPVSGLLERWLVDIEGFIVEQQAQAAPGYNALAARIIELLVITALRDWLREPRNQVGGLLGLFDPAVSRVLLVMHNKPGERWTLSSLAAAAGCSRASLAKRFHKFVGETPFAYLTRLRISLAATRLSETHQSVSTIAEELGYSNAFALSRAFAQIMNQTPSVYRRSQSMTNRSPGSFYAVGYPAEVAAP